MFAKLADVLGVRRRTLLPGDVLDSGDGGQIAGPLNGGDQCKDEGDARREETYAPFEAVKSEYDLSWSDRRSTRTPGSPPGGRRHLVVF
jgi:hypothetical protein